MSNETPKNATQAQSVKSLLDDEKIKELKLQNQICREIIQNTNNQKKDDDAQALLHNAKILNNLSKKLVKIFFGKWFFVWIMAYIALNIALSFFAKGSFYISVIDKVVLFVIVCVLGKFLKDNLSLFIEMLKKDKHNPS